MIISMMIFSAQVTCASFIDMILYVMKYCTALLFVLVNLELACIYIKPLKSKRQSKSFRSENIMQVLSNSKIKAHYLDEL